MGEVYIVRQDNHEMSLLSQLLLLSITLWNKMRLYEYEHERRNEHQLNCNTRKCRNKVTCRPRLHRIFSCSKNKSACKTSNEAPRNHRNYKTDVQISICILRMHNLHH